MKKFIHVFEGQIVARYSAEMPTIFGGPWVEGESFEVPEGVDLQLAILVDGQVVERELTEDEVFKNEVNESQSYVADIQKGQHAIAFFRLLNDKKGLTAQQKMQALSNPSLQVILQLLSVGNLSEAIVMINELEADGVIVTEDDQHKLIKFLGE